MDGGESPLDVLSRAATMLQENLHSAPVTEDSSKLNTTKQLPTTKWKRDRRTRAEYSRKSDPKIPDVFGQESSYNGEVQNGHHQPQQVYGSSNPNADTPLDMSLRQRGQPPSYAQTINNPSYRSSYRTSVITPNLPLPRDEIPPSGISMCDPIIDEHFRRSLGKDYIKIFSNNNVPQKDESPIIIKSTPKMNTNVIELMDNAGLSVDDHFAKALGDTWLKLNKKENELGNQSTDKETIMSV